MCEGACPRANAKETTMPRAVGRNRAKHCKQNSPASLSGRRCGAGKPCAGWPRPCPPPHAAFRTLCPQAGQSVRSEAHYAAAVPRRARPTSGGGRSKTGQSAALTCRRSLCPGGAVVRGALRKVAASLSAAARGVSDTLPSNRAKCSLRGALRGGSAAPGSAGIGRRTEQNGPERRPDLPSVSLSGRRWGWGSLARGDRVPARRAALPALFFRPHFPGLPRLRPADPRGPLRAP